MLETTELWLICEKKRPKHKISQLLTNQSSALHHVTMNWPIRDEWSDSGPVIILTFTRGRVTPSDVIMSEPLSVIVSSSYLYTLHASCQWMSNEQSEQWHDLRVNSKTAMTERFHKWVQFYRKHCCLPLHHLSHCNVWTQSSPVSH